jgi:hypothetical protein
VEQNDHGRIGSLFRRASPLIEHQHDDELEHDYPNFGIWVYFNSALKQTRSVLPLEAMKVGRKGLRPEKRRNSFLASIRQSCSQFSAGRLLFRNGKI